MADKPGGILATIKDLITRAKGLDEIRDAIALEFDQKQVGVIAYDANSQAATYEDVVNISDKGVLTGITSLVFSTSNAHDGTILVTIDGGALTAMAVFSRVPNLDDTTNSQSLSFGHRFDTSLRVQHKKSNGLDNIYTSVAYTID